MTTTTDCYPPEVRSRVMSRIRSRDTKPELALRRALFAIGARGWRCNRCDLPGKPDLAFGPVHLAVFVDGAWWHGHPSKFTPGKSSEYWDAKIRGNMAHDERVNAALATAGWRVVRLWDFEVVHDPEGAAAQVAAEVAAAAAGS
jgi:DNA mismatch endonuclease (patch repair protein)